jgi:hypothetical protein
MVDICSPELVRRSTAFWLNSRGARTLSDLKVDLIGNKYTLMGDGYGGMKWVYLPDDLALVEMYRSGAVY